MTVKQTVEITNKLGMHARPAMKLFVLMPGLMKINAAYGPA